MVFIVLRFLFSNINLLFWSVERLKGYKETYGLKSICFEECSPGYSGPNCTIKCVYPSYGETCQEICDCEEKICDILTGCKILTTGILFCYKK